MILVKKIPVLKAILNEDLLTRFDLSHSGKGGFLLAGNCDLGIVVAVGVGRKFFILLQGLKKRSVVFL